MKEKTLYPRRKSPFSGHFLGAFSNSIRFRFQTLITALGYRHLVFALIGLELRLGKDRRPIVRRNYGTRCLLI